MSFKLENFGADASNVKSILGGANYYRYFNKDNNTLTAPGYFPADLGLAVGDRIKVIPSVKTNPDEEYIVSDITNRVVTVTKVEAGLDTSKVVNADVLPTASADEAGKFYLYTGDTTASYTHGYIYECIATPVYDATVEFNPASVSGTTAACSGSDFAAFVAANGSGDIDTIIKGTITYDQSGDLLVFVGQDDTNTTVCTFQVYTQDYIDAGFTFTGTFQDTDVIAFTCTIEETGATYAWERKDVQPVPDALQNTATGTDALTILGTPSENNKGINIGAGSSIYGGSNAIAVGYNSSAGNAGVAVGSGTTANSTSSVAIGEGARATGYGAIQIGSGTNSATNSLKVKGYLLMSSDGTVPSDRLPNAINKYATMPTAASTNEGWIVQYTGATDATYTHGHLYECVSDGQDPATYSWTEVSMGGSSLPDQTGQSGKFLTTDGTDASWGTINALQNTATEPTAFSIAGTATGYEALSIKGAAAGTRSIAIGSNAETAVGTESEVAIGRSSTTRGNYACAIGTQATASGANCLAIGYEAYAGKLDQSVYGAFQIGNGLNSEAGTLCVALTTTNSYNRANWNNYKVLNSDGTIPADRLGDTTGLTAGNYRPRLTIDAQGNKTITWVAE